MKLSSPEFREGEMIPSMYTCDGDRFLSPPLHIADVPAEAQSLVLIMDDPDVPKAIIPEGLFTHWVLFNIPTDTMEIPAGEVHGVQGLNTRGDPMYTGPCPPPDYEPSTHRYFFKLTALDTTLPLLIGASREDVERLMEGHEIAFAECMATYVRTPKV